MTIKIVDCSQPVPMVLPADKYTKYGLTIRNKYLNTAMIMNNTEKIPYSKVINEKIIENSNTDDNFIITSSANNIYKRVDSLLKAECEIFHNPYAQTIWHEQTDQFGRTKKKVVFKRKYLSLYENTKENNQ